MKRGPKPNSYAATESDYATNYVQEYVNCGKPNCKKCADGKQGHGPYWYSYHYSPTLKRYVKKYVGKKRGEALEDTPPQDQENARTTNNPSPIQLTNPMEPTSPAPHDEAQDYSHRSTHEIPEAHAQHRKGKAQYQDAHDQPTNHQRK